MRADVGTAIADAASIDAAQNCRQPGLFNNIVRRLILIRDRTARDAAEVVGRESAIPGRGLTFDTFAVALSRGISSLVRDQNVIITPGKWVVLVQAFVNSGEALPPHTERNWRFAESVVAASDKKLKRPGIRFADPFSQVQHHRASSSEDRTVILMASRTVTKVTLSIANAGLGGLSNIAAERDGFNAGICKFCADGAHHRNGGGLITMDAERNGRSPGSSGP